MSGMFAAAAAGVRTIGLQTPECGIAELWRCWIVTHRAAKLPECGAAAKRVERPAPGAVSSGRDADAPSRLLLPGHKCSPSFFPGGGDTLRAVPGRIRALHNPFPAGFAPIPTRSRPDSRSSQPVLAGFALFTTLSRPDSRPSQPAPGPNSHAARTVPATRGPGCPPAESRPPRAAKPQGLRFGRRIARAEMQRGSDAGNSDRRSTKPPWHRPVWDRFGRSGSDRPAAGENRTPHAADNPDAGASNGDGRDDPAKALRQPSVVSTTCR